MISCAEARARLWEYLDGELVERESVEAVRAHLDGCLGCTRVCRLDATFLARLAALAAALGAPPMLGTRIRLRIHDA